MAKVSPRSGMLAFDGEWKTLKENPFRINFFVNIMNKA